MFSTGLFIDLTFSLSDKLTNLTCQPDFYVDLTFISLSNILINHKYIYNGGCIVVLEQHLAFRD